MTIPARRWVHILVAALGLALMVGGTVVRKPGAAIIGLLIAAVNLQLFRRSWAPRDA
jgi:ABC-type thiamin/hydroxymethylpyrimidine transport system permease subunit